MVETERVRALGCRIRPDDPTPSRQIWLRSLSFQPPLRYLTLCEPLICIKSDLASIAPDLTCQPGCISALDVILPPIERNPGSTSGWPATPSTTSRTYRHLHLLQYAPSAQPLSSQCARITVARGSLADSLECCNGY